MFTVTEAAQNEIARYFENRTPAPIRVFLNSGGCGGPQLAMAVDQQNDGDTLFTIDGMAYIIDTELLNQAQPLVVDFKDVGFKLSSSLKLSSGCSSCGSHGSCCS
ncbi:IscA/HesB family protein [Desulfoluna spongiiphila]|uniref:Fe-S cluster assembly iron-binding protein IscA n=1 Tax=Desulfoluna spongiiphila TaxID=419481 RepID=A0A1G5FDQ8_9BACT|nr:IscA/HesB family protein [Desulfoluna spongiiphila]SCY37271.1 Fe-S cluster assembly iron-binding protein IscA [Desulfoluna spongiiphila]VVS95659.1 fes cluster biogenesis [Desulfoluna spongiiphila]